MPQKIVARKDPRELLPISTLYPSLTWIVAYGYTSKLEEIRKELRKQKLLGNVVRHIASPEWARKRVDEQGEYYTPQLIFPGYLFLEMEDLTNPQWAELEEVEGISRVLQKLVRDRKTQKWTHIPYVLVPEEVVHVMRLTSLTLIHKKEDKQSYLGQLVSITAGPFKKMRGVVIEDGDNMILIELAVLHRIIPVRITRSCVRLANDFIDEEMLHNEL